MRKTRLFRPEYADRFGCIGSACEDDCCHGWRVSVDEAAYRKYQALPNGPLRGTLDAVIERTTEKAAVAGRPAYAHIKMLPSGSCPMLTAEGLCRIHAELGAEYLCHTCTTYPRTRRCIDKLEEQSLSLSCPEAARLVLLAERLLPPDGAPGFEITWNDTTIRRFPLRRHFWPIRDFTMRLVMNRSYPLWQRLFLLGTFSRRLEAIESGELKRTFPDFLRDFVAAVESGTLSASMEGIRPDLGMQLEMVLRLVNLRSGHLLAGPRLVEYLGAFVEGIDSRPGVPLEIQMRRYQTAYRDSYAPFFARHPHILENYLLNQMFRGLFPFGDQMFQPSAKPEFAKAFASMAAQFALIKGLLIGIAGFHGERFSADHVVAAVQVVSRHFEHSPQFLHDAGALLAERNMDNAHGLTMLLRN